jgi:hypothetical protein
MIDLFLGVGGHGCLGTLGKYIFAYNNWLQEADPKLMASPSSKKIISLSTVDSGGSTGTQLDTLKLNNFELNKKLHGDRNHPLLPYGDLKQFFIYSLSLNKPSYNWLEILDHRSNDLDTHLEKIDIINQALNTKQNTELFVELKKYFREYLVYFNENISKLPEIKQKPVCLGNVFSAFLHYYFGDRAGLNNGLIKLGIIPEWVELIFIFCRHCTLCSQDIHGRSVKDEEVIDEWQEELLPEKYCILDGDSVADLDKYFIESLELEGLNVFLTPGSDANWLGVINHPEVLGRIHKKNLTWVPNNYHGPNETPMYLTYQHLVKGLGLNINTTLPSKKDLLSVLNDQSGKTFLIDFLNKKNLLPNFGYDFVEEEMLFMQNLLERKIEIGRAHV